MASVETAMRRLGYLSTGETEKRTFEIVLSTSSQFGSFRGYAEVVEGIVARAVEVGGNVRFGPALGFEDGQGLRETASSTRIGVVILGKCIVEEEKELDYLHRQGIPFVLINRMMDDSCSSFFLSIFVKQRRMRSASFFTRTQAHCPVGRWIYCVLHAEGKVQRLL